MSLSAKLLLIFIINNTILGEFPKKLDWVIYQTVSLK